MSWGDQAVTICSDVSDLIRDAFDWVGPDSIPTAPDKWPNADHTRTRDYLTEYSLYDLTMAGNTEQGLIRCTVTPGSYEAEWVSRQMRKETYGIDVVLLYKTSTRDRRDYAMEQMETLIRVLEDTPLVNTAAQWIGVERPTLFDSDRLDEQNVFATSSRHTYVFFRDKGVATEVSDASSSESSSASSSESSSPSLSESSSESPW